VITVGLWLRCLHGGQGVSGFGSVGVRCVRCMRGGVVRRGRGPLVPRVRGRIVRVLNTPKKKPHKHEHRLPKKKEKEKHGRRVSWVNQQARMSMAGRPLPATAAALRPWAAAVRRRLRTRRAMPLDAVVADRRRLRRLRWRWLRCRRQRRQRWLLHSNCSHAKAGGWRWRWRSRWELEKYVPRWRRWWCQCQRRHQLARQEVTREYLIKHR
jgi:hypothetical protein